MIKTPKIDELTPVNEAKIFVDTFADVVGVSGYEISGVDYVNLSFMKHVCIPCLDNSGYPVSNKLAMERVASITLNKNGALALFNILSEFISITNSSDENEDKNNATDNK